MVGKKNLGDDSSQLLQRSLGAVDSIRARAPAVDEGGDDASLFIEAADGRRILFGSRQIDGISSPLYMHV